MESRQSTEQTRQAYWDNYINYWLERVADSNTTKENADRMPDDRIMASYVKLLVDSLISNSSLGARHSACGDFLGGSSLHSSWRMSNTPHSFSSHSPKNSSAILECQSESSPKDSKAVSESTASVSHSSSESPSVIASVAKQSIKQDSESVDCHADKSARNDKSLESPADSEPTSTAGLKQTKPQGEVSCDDFRGCAGTSKGDKARIKLESSDIQVETPTESKHSKISKETAQGLFCDEKSGLSSEQAKSKVHCLESSDIQAAGFSDDFRGFQAKGEGSYLEGNNRALSAESAKSAEKPTRLHGGGGGQYQILDYGCGFGRAYPYFENLNCAYHGCDIAQSCIDHTLSAHPRATARKLLEDDRIDFPSEYFDGVFCYGVFDACYQHITLLEILRVLKVGGIALITGKNDNYLESDEPALIAEVGARKNKHPNYFTNLPHLLSELKKRNIAILHTRFFTERKDSADDKFIEQMPRQFYAYTLLIQKREDSILTPFEPFSHAYSQTFLSKDKSL